MFCIYTQLELLCNYSNKYYTIPYFITLIGNRANFAVSDSTSLTYAGHSWPLSSEGSLACHTFCDKGHPFIMVISEDP